MLPRGIEHSVAISTRRADPCTQHNKRVEREKKED